MYVDQYQKEVSDVLKYRFTHQKGTVFAADVGTGKTRITIHALKDWHHHQSVSSFVKKITMVLVVIPCTVISHWENEIHTLGEKSIRSVAYTGNPDKRFQKIIPWMRENERNKYLSRIVQPNNDSDSDSCVFVLTNPQLLLSEIGRAHV